MTYVISTVAVLVFPLGSLKVSVTVLAEPEIMLDGMLDEKAESPSGIVITRLGTAVTSELEIDILRPGAPAIPFNTTVIGIGWPPATTEVFTVADSIVGGNSQTRAVRNTFEPSAVMSNGIAKLLAVHVHDVTALISPGGMARTILVVPLEKVKFELSVVRTTAIPLAGAGPLAMTRTENDPPLTTRDGTASESKRTP